MSGDLLVVHLSPPILVCPADTDYGDRQFTDKRNSLHSSYGWESKQGARVGKGALVHVVMGRVLAWVCDSEAREWSVSSEHGFRWS